MGGTKFCKNRLHCLLTNRIYLGQVCYREKIYEGEHDGIVSEAAFAAVQKRLQANRVGVGDKMHERSKGSLAGLLHCTACNSMMTHSSSGGAARKRTYRYYTCNKATKRGRKTCPRASLPAEDIELFVVRQLESLTIDEELLNSICRQVRSKLTTKHSDLLKERESLVDETYRMEQATQALTTPSDQAELDEHRMNSLATLNEQCGRNQRRLAALEIEIAKYGRPAPNRVAILQAVKDLETLWTKMTTAERSRFMHSLIDRVDHNPRDSEIEIKLSETGLQLLASESDEGAEA